MLGATDARSARKGTSTGSLDEMRNSGFWGGSGLANGDLSSLEVGSWDCGTLEIWSLRV